MTKQPTEGDPITELDLQSLIDLIDELKMDLAKQHPGQTVDAELAYMQAIHLMMSAIMYERNGRSLDFKTANQNEQLKFLQTMVAPTIQNMINTIEQTWPIPDPKITFELDDGQQRLKWGPNPTQS